jgi:hypothetical protein
VSWEGPGLEAWRPWQPAELARRLTGSRACWSVVGGWSIDLFAGRATRAHHDLELATIPSDLAALRRQLGGVFFAVGGGRVRRLDDDEPTPAGCHQHWLLDEAAGAWRVDVMVEPGDAATWVFRRDERVRAPRGQMTARTSAGIPYLRPHGALLYKAASCSAKDEADFDAVAAHLADEDRRWLEESLELVYPGHPWLARLRG